VSKAPTTQVLLRLRRSVHQTGASIPTRRELVQSAMALSIRPSLRRFPAAALRQIPLLLSARTLPGCTTASVPSGDAAAASPRMSAAAQIQSDGDGNWSILENGEVRATHPSRAIRSSILWKAAIEERASNSDNLTLDRISRCPPIHWPAPRGFFCCSVFMLTQPRLLEDNELNRKSGYRKSCSQYLNGRLDETHSSPVRWSRW